MLPTDDTATALAAQLAAYMENFGVNVADRYDPDRPCFYTPTKELNVAGPADMPRAVGYAMAYMMHHTRAVTKIMKRRLARMAAYHFRKPVTGLARRLPDVMPPPSDLEWERAKAEMLESLGDNIGRLLQGGEAVMPAGLPMPEWAEYEVLFAECVAEGVLAGNTRLILRNSVFSDPDEPLELMDLGEAFRRNPYAESLVAIMSAHNFAMVGSPPLALAGTVYRPRSKVLHDLDFVPVEDLTREEAEARVRELFPYAILLCHNRRRRVWNGRPDLLVSATFLIPDCFVTIEDSTTELGLSLLYDADHQLLGRRERGTITMSREGAHAIILEVFVGPNRLKFPPSWQTVNGKWYLFNDWRDSLATKTQMRGSKHIWDYNRWMPKDKKILKNTK